MSVFAFTSDSANIFAVGDAMEAKGWHIDRQPNPDALHLMITPAHAAIVDIYLSDLRASVEDVLAHPEKANEGMAAMYGMVARLPDRAMANEMLIQYIADASEAEQSGFSDGDIIVAIDGKKIRGQAALLKAINFSVGKVSEFMLKRERSEPGWYDFFARKLTIENVFTVDEVFAKR